ncbi:MAG: PEP-CTERM sorting domain-containing protein [Verrucomicrobiales bacterium]|jgi:hypothetical protein|nr:PEP-CTERM sorting domain-containing protein [Verrucomicrobiales bacterium]
MNKSLIVVSCLRMLMIGTVHASTSEWWKNTATGGVDNDINNVVNWASALTTSDTARFNNNSGNKIPVLNSNMTLSSIMILGSDYNISSVNDAAFTIEGTGTTTSVYGLGITGADVIFSANLVLGTGGVQSIYSSKNTIVSGNISGNATLLLRIGGTLTLSGSNSYMGETRYVGASAVLLNIGSANALSTGNLVWTTGGQLDNTTGSALILANHVDLSNDMVFVGSDNLTVGSLDLGSSTAGANRNITINDQTLTVTESAVSSGNTARILNKYGGGALIIKGDATSTGKVSAATGTLIIDGNVVGAVDIADGAKFGAGSVAGLVTTKAVGSTIIVGGDEVGSTTFSANFDVRLGAIFDMQLGDAVSDELTVEGKLRMNADTLLAFNLLDAGDFSDGVYDLLTLNGLYGGSGELTDAKLSTYDLSNITLNYDTNQWKLDTSYGTDGILFDTSGLSVSFLVIPEPATWLLLGLGAATLTVYRWRRR